MTAVLTVLVLMALGGVVKAEQCPFEAKCDCTDNPYSWIANGEGKFIDCRSKGLSSVPTGINTWNTDQITVV